MKLTLHFSCYNQLRKGLSRCATVTFLCLALNPILSYAEETIYQFSFSLMGLPPLSNSSQQSIEDVDDFSIYGVYFENEAGEAQSIRSIPLQFRSSLFNYRGTGPLVFFRQLKNEDGTIQQQVLAKVQPQSDWQRVLIFALPKQQGAPNGFATTVISDSARDFPVNTVRMINFTQGNLATMVGEQMEPIEPGKNVLIPVNITSPRMVPIRLAMYVPDNGDWRSIFSSSIPFRGNQRFLYLILPDRSDRATPRMPPIIIRDQP